MFPPKIQVQSGGKYSLDHIIADPAQGAAAHDIALWALLPYRVPLRFILTGG